MVNFNSNVAKMVIDNTVVINNQITYTLTDDEVTKVNDIIKGLISSRNSQSAPTTAPVASVAKKSEIVGKKVYTEDFLTVTDNNGEYRLYITCPVKGDKGKKIRTAIKLSAKEYGTKFAGNYDAGEIYWTFNTKTAANKFIKARKDYAKNNK